MDTGAKLYVYSSREGGKIFNAGYDSARGEINSWNVVNVSGENTQVFFGEFTKDGVMVPGDNLSVYTYLFANVQAYYLKYCFHRYFQ